MMMNVSSFVSPLETVQFLSIFSYVNTLSDFLFTENFLNESDQYKHIPIVNALYHYLDNNHLNQDQTRKMYLAKKLINNTDLFGSKSNETLDPNFVNSLFNHIVNSLVFDKFTNVFGFIIETLRFTTNDSFNYLMHHLMQSLRELKFENEFGDDSILDSHAIDNIFKNLIEPLFPHPEEHPTRVTSVDYIYAQAGKMFLRSGQTEALKNSSESFQEYIEIAHTVEQLVLAKKINETILRIFALPALVNYMYNEKRIFKFDSTAKIINSPEHWMNAYKSLFSRLNEAFLEIEKTQNEDYRYQFYLALASNRNRTTLAKETIELECPPLTSSEMDQEVTRYKNEPETYSCKNDPKILDNLNLAFEYLMNNITEKYNTYEKESCREAFGENFINWINQEKVIITKGLIHYPFGSPIGFEFTAHQLIRPSDDLFEFYFPYNETFLYFALVRSDYNVTMIKDTDNPILFRQKLGLKIDESLKDKYFPITMKDENEDFEVFLTRIASQRSKQFGAILKASEYDQTRKEWWRDFGLSMIPFYSCVQDIRAKNALEASIFCPLDVLFFIPVVGEVGSLAGKMTTAAMKSVVALSATTVRTITLRTSLRTALRLTGKVLILEMKEFVGLINKQTFRKIGIASLRFIDPGFELLFRLGTGSLNLIKRTIIRLENIHLTSFRSVKFMLDQTQKAIVNFPKSIGKLSGKRVYVNSLTDTSGYGYKFIPINNELAEIRTVYPSRTELPVVSRFSGDEKIYRKIDIETGMIGDEYFVDDEGFVVSEEKMFEMNIESDDDKLLEGGNFVTTVMGSLKSRRVVLTEAVKFAMKKDKVPEAEVRQELKKYAFPETGKTEMNFVEEWMAHPQLKTPLWAEKFRIEEPEVFYYLKTKLLMDYPELSLKEAKLRIETLYPPSEYGELLKELPIEKVLDDFKAREIYRQANFEDYYALRNYGASGYRKMGEDCHQSRRMKIAIYRLAIRQSEDPGEQCVRKLFRGEKRNTETIEREIYPGRETIQLNRFTSTTTDIETANLYSETVKPDNTKIIYTINMNEPYLRARVEHLFVLDEKETILLPGTEFHIGRIEKGVHKKLFGPQKYMNVELTLAKTSMVENQQRIMKEIKKLMETDTVFYAKDLAH